MAGHYLFIRHYYGLENDSTFISRIYGPSAVVPVQKERPADVAFLHGDGQSGECPQVLCATAGGVPAAVPFRVRKRPSGGIRRFAFHRVVRPPVPVQACRQMAAPHPREPEDFRACGIRGTGCRVHSPSVHDGGYRRAYSFGSRVLSFPYGFERMEGRKNAGTLEETPGSVARLLLLTPMLIAYGRRT